MDELIKKYFQRELNNAERLEFLKRVESDDELQKQFIEYKNMYALLSISDQVDNIQESRSAYKRLSRLLQTKKIHRVLIRTISYAAIITLLIISTHFISVNYFSKPFVSDVINTLYVPAGQRVKLTLQDGTDVWLNAQTTLTYPALFTENERRVTIDGEAYFDVAKNPEKPFIVSTQGIEMKVLGTEFNVYSYQSEGYVQASLITGALHVYFPDRKSQGVVLKPNDQVTIKGSRISMDKKEIEEEEHLAIKGTQMSIQKITHSDYFLWKDGIYSFENELLIHMLKKLELYYDVKIVVKDPSIYQWEYTGKFRQRDGIEEILRMIQVIHKFTIEKNETNNVFTLNR